MTETEREIYDYLIQTDAPMQDVGVADDLFGSGVLDSLGVADLVAFIEQRYGMDVAMSDIIVENFGSVAAIAAYVTPALSAL